MRDGVSKGIADECPVCGEQPVRKRYYKYKEDVGQRNLPREAFSMCVEFRDSDLYPFAVYFHPSG